MQYAKRVYMEINLIFLIVPMVFDNNNFCMYGKSQFICITCFLSTCLQLNLRSKALEFRLCYVYAAHICRYWNPTTYFKLLFSLTSYSPYV